jgi:hypothetical protein
MPEDLKHDFDADGARFSAETGQFLYHLQTYAKSPLSRPTRTSTGSPSLGGVSGAFTLLRNAAVQLSSLAEPLYGDCF